MAVSAVRATPAIGLEVREVGPIETPRHLDTVYLPATTVLAHGDASHRPRRGSVPRVRVVPVHGGRRSGTGVAVRRADHVGTAWTPPNRPHSSGGAAGQAALVRLERPGMAEAASPGGRCCDGRPRGRGTDVPGARHSGLPRPRPRRGARERAGGASAAPGADCPRVPATAGATRRPGLALSAGAARRHGRLAACQRRLSARPFPGHGWGARRVAVGVCQGGGIRRQAGARPRLCVLCLFVDQWALRVFEKQRVWATVGPTQSARPGPARLTPLAHHPTTLSDRLYHDDIVRACPPCQLFHLLHAQDLSSQAGDQMSRSARSWRK